MVFLLVFLKNLLIASFYKKSISTFCSFAYSMSGIVACQLYTELEQSILGIIISSLNAGPPALYSIDSVILPQSQPILASKFAINSWPTMLNVLNSLIKISCFSSSNDNSFSISRSPGTLSDVNSQSLTLTGHSGILSNRGKGMRIAFSPSNYSRMMKVSIKLALMNS